MLFCKMCGFVLFHPVDQLNPLLGKLAFGYYIFSILKNTLSLSLLIFHKPTSFWGMTNALYERRHVQYYNGVG